MNLEVLGKWIKALESGEFERPSLEAEQFELRRGDSYELLGILCELHRREFGGDWKEEDGRFNYFGARNFPSNEVLIWLDVSPKPVDENRQPIDGLPIIRWLSLYNRGNSFVDIAKEIRVYVDEKNQKG